MIHHLRAAGTSLVLDASGSGTPVIVHWGADLGELPAADLAALAAASVPPVGPSSLDVPLRLSLLPALAEGWSGRPALGGFRTGTGTLDPALALVAVHEGGDNTVVIELADADASVTVSTELELTVQGVLRLRHTLTNSGAGTLELAGLDAILPVPDRAAELLDFTGLWSHERRPQRSILGQGVWSRESRHGRPGHDDSYLTVAGTPGFGFRRGEVWAVHLAHSGDKVVWAERSALGYAALGAGELLAPGELSLAAGASYTSPWTVAVYSDAGLDGLSARLHPWIRSWSTITGPRPVLLNTWEAVYFDHDLPTLSRLVDAAAQVGVERFVLDDGWFSGRTDDQRALGDWFVDADKWPEGLHPLIERVHAAGLDFGLWVEPEMVNPDSDLARAHPDWLLGSASAPTWRGQRVLDLANPDAFAWLLERLTALLAEYPIAYLKWDHNRDLLGGSVHRQTAALYRLIDAVRAAQPGLEIESCASGGGRIDLGILERVDRVWTSDTNDPLERQQIQRYTSVLVPPEYLGGHLGAATAHTTGRTSALGFRLATALFGSAGIEWDLTQASAVELDQIAAWIAIYKEHRALLHSGNVVHADGSDPAIELHGVVATDGSAAVFAQVALAAPRTALPAPIRFPGLDPARRYRVRPLLVGPVSRTVQTVPPAWLAADAGELVLTGAVLAEVGLPAPLLTPEQAALFTLDAV
ncbi:MULTISPECIES: alpha-galactosidase [unclassified Cryobacterium]|uniref:alpha-galactosidase n=1 Tax=unclassified Cryobacterium TaxID=2649013 RepID=UPI00106D630D|nr:MULTISPECIES: alpha-galactosidase [unclassified Cryobacterium]TFC50287.1 alpha-galactosidase [Cryobacterium sp. TMB3-1-2]TFC71979.1 alpha-galactosidase [Cryobacterium sp. TMB3-15]TFC78572.1 alpha-galactosidase [Cryobacterium sp. TMB3-10]TFD39259.1 alpha-galactosidase [Cryobacterium sp. TMB3-12]